MAGYNEQPDLGTHLISLEQRIAALEGAGGKNAPWHAPTLLNGFANLGSGYAPAGYYIDGQGRVNLRGRIDAPTDTFTDTLLFVLEEGFRPTYIHDFPLVSGSFEFTPVWCSATVNPNGQVTVSGGQIETFPLDPVSFRIT